MPPVALFPFSLAWMEVQTREDGSGETEERPRCRLACGRAGKVGMRLRTPHALSVLQLFSSLFDFGGRVD